MKKYLFFMFVMNLILVYSSGAISSVPNTSYIFVHGANLSSSSWQPLKESLERQLKNKDLVFLDLPGRNDTTPFSSIDLDFTAKSLCESLSKIEGKKVLIGHSQGGAVINQATSFCSFSNVTKIIYIAAVVPLPGEKVFQQLEKADEENYLSGIMFDEKNMEMRIFDNEKFLNSFAHDANKEQKELILKSAVNEPALIGEGELNFNKVAFDKIEKFYVKTMEDKIISPATQDKIIKNVNFKKVFQIRSSHLPMVVLPDELSKIFIKIDSI